MSKRREHPIPPDILVNPNNKWRLVTLMDVLTMLRHIHEGAVHPKVGFLDANETLESITKILNRKRIWLQQSTLESALWSCNLLDELNQFKDYRGRTFDQFLRDLLETNKESFNRFYNLIQTKDGIE